MVKENNVVQIKPYKKVQKPRTEWMPIEDFLDTPPVFCQRQTEYRAPKIKKLLEERFFESHLEVAIFEYPSGKRVRGNGNTRADIWSAMKEDGGFENIPDHVQATVYYVKNDEDAKKLYYTFDSDDSVEKSPDKITGVYRALGLHGKFNNTKIAKGTIGKSLSYASFNRESNKPTSQTNWFEIIEDFKEELLTLDKLGPKKIFDSNIICASLMMLKQHGTTNKRLIDGLKQLNSGAKGAQCPNTGTDGITFILEEWTTNNIFEAKGTDAFSYPRQQDFLLYCFERWMDKKNVKIYRRPSEGRTGKGRRKSLYDSFWENEEG
tara:strand:- start:5235 stop:6197 length:963 start_codon:yes stop_codon:yes gene_type:complete